MIVDLLWWLSFAAFAVTVLILVYRPGASWPTVWDVVPEWQYGGRLVEAGGLTREEQEESVAEASERGEELDAVRRQ